MQHSSRFRTIALAGAALVGTGILVPPVQAQGSASQAETGTTFDIGAMSLAEAAKLFTAQSGVTVQFATDGAGAVVVSAVRGTFTIPDAFTRLVAGAGVSWHRASSGAIIVDGVVSADAGGEHVLQSVRVEGSAGGGSGVFAPLDGFGRGAGANGSTDVTATEGTGSLTTNGTSIASKMPLSFKETPQSVSAITSEQIKQQNLTDVAAALNVVPGITLNYRDGNTPTFISRGFVVNTMVVDGGAPLLYPGGSSIGGSTRPFASTPDLSEYDHIEVLKGSAALFGGAGDPGGAVNLQRKRPLDHSQFIATGHYGSYDNGRAEIDMTGPATADGHLRARVDVAFQNQHFFYDFANRRTVHAYGVIEGDLGVDTVLRAGASYEWRHERGENFNGLPRFGNGADLNLPRSKNFSAPWAYVDSRTDEQFVQFEHAFGDRWKLELSGTRVATRSEGLSPQYQGSGIRPNGSNFLYVGPYLATVDTEQYVADGHVNGKFNLFGFEQQILIGADYQHVTPIYQQLSNFVLTSVNVFTHDPASIPAPAPLTAANANSNLYSRSPNQQIGAYLNVQLQPVAGLHLNGGVRYTDYTSDLDSINITQFQLVPGGPLFPFRSSSKLRAAYHNNFTPSAGIVYDVTRTISVYGSYADIFRPTGPYVTAANELIPPLRGRTFETGVKFAPANGKLNVSLALFDVIQRNVPLQASTGPTTIGTCCFVAGAAIHNRGIEAQLSGEVLPHWQINAGYTYLDISYNDVYRDYLTGPKASQTPVSLTQQPAHQGKIWTSYDLPGALSPFTIAGGLRVESSRLTYGTSCMILTPTSCSGTAPFRFTQGAYAVFDASLTYRVANHFEMTVNLTNLTDRHYYTSTGNANFGNYYGEPRQVLVSLRAKY